MSAIGNVSSIYAQRDLAVTHVSVPGMSAFDNKTKDGIHHQELKNEKAQSTKVTISEEALKQLGLEKKSSNLEDTKPASGLNELTPEEQKQIAEMKSRDQEVRAHEMAHMMVGGSLVRKGVSYQYQTGPDGRRYAVGGEVSIDSSAVSGDPSATIHKMQQVKRAALAPAEPSSQDRAVAASAAQTEAAARQELLQQAAENTETNSFK